MPPVPPRAPDADADGASASRPPSRPAPGAAAMAAVAVLSVLGVTGGITGAVLAADLSAAPVSMPPGPDDRGGVVDQQPAAGERGSAPESGPTAGPGAPGDGAGDPDRAADSRPSPEDPAPPAEQWLERTATATGVPSRALLGYATAQLRMETERPDCRISWPTLAGIGSVESDHGRYAGGEIGPDGRTTVDVIGIPLDGGNDTAVITDTDDGAVDGDPVHDRAVGPMQFIPSTWETWGTSATGGEPDPHSIDDAALSAARYLCADGRDLTTDDGWWAALWSYNRSTSYGEDVLALANGYADSASR